jgi:DNA replication protein DnaC
LKPELNSCPHNCDQNGFIWYRNDEGYEVAKECVCRKQKVESKRISFANIPEAFKGMMLDNFHNDIYRQKESQKVINILLKAIRLYMDNIESHKTTGKGLYIYSDEKGSGKTRMAASIANELMKNHNTRVKFATSSKIVQEIRATWDKETRTCTQTELISALATAEVLIIDDFGIEKIYDFVNENFYSIINERYNSKKITIYTSNYQLHDLPYEDRIRSRVKETTFILHFPEESVRDYIAEQDNAAMINELRRN